MPALLALSVSGCALIRDADIDVLFEPQGSLDGTDGTDGTTDSTDGVVDADGDGFSPPEDCDDGDPTRYPGATEWLDEVDHDCDGDTSVVATALTLPAEAGTVGPADLLTRTAAADPTLVLAWSSERCAGELAPRRRASGAASGSRALARLPP